MAKKKFDPKAKAKRQKVIAAVGGVLLLGVLAIQVPRTMKMMKGDESTSSTPPAATSTTAGSTPLAPPTLDGSAAAASGSTAASSAAAVATTADGVSDPSNPLPPNAGQLVSFSKFKSKDPFHQQIADCASGCASASTPASSNPVSTANPNPNKEPSLLIARGSTPVSGAATSATISVNGTRSTVTVGSAFPAAAPVFTLVSLTAGAAKIGIAGGAYENGAATVTLKKGKTVTLMNTANGTRYVLRLVSTA